jgi:hypothetical protein|tara:strand:- start:1625 stop:2266 length:642 start_codon:yes stop_codon:yes gene_type:complete
MKVKIKKKGKVKEFKLISSWKDVTLEKWIKLVDFHNGTKSSEALETIAELSNIPKDLIKQLELKDVALIMSKVAEMQQEQNSSLKRVIEIEGKRYGFHPDLDSITLGEWSDIETFIKQDIEKNLPEVMAILYREIEEEKNDIYTIKAYDGNISIRTEVMKKMSAEQVQSALVFFYHFVTKLSEILPSYLMERLKEMNKQLPQNLLPKSGDTLE